MSALSQKMLQKLETYKAHANECTLIKYIFNQNDLNDDQSDKNPIFKPEYMHQIFGDDELIFGYKNLRVNYYLTPALLHAYIGLVYSEKITPQRFENIEPDDVFHEFQQFGCSPGFTRSLDLFCSEKLKQDYEFRPFGTKIHEYRREVKSIENNSAPTVSTYEVYKVDLTCSDYHNQKFIEYLQRVQTLLIFFIETADFTDTDDDQWVYYFLYEKRQSQDSTSNERYATAGFTSVYNYYAYPDKKRTRISQMLITPPYQHGGHGAQLMECIYKDAVQNPDILDVTAEGPSDNFVKLRDFVTCTMCMQLDSFKNSDALKKGFSVDMAVEALKRFKMPKLQSRRCYEILRYRVTDENNATEWRDYRLDVKKRLYLPFIRKCRFARTGGNLVNPSDQNESENLDEQPQASKSSKKVVDRFGSNEPECVTQIGFGAPPTASNGKSVRFTEQPKSAFDSRFGSGPGVAKRVGFQPNSSAGDDEDDDDDDDDDDDEDADEIAEDNAVKLVETENINQLLFYPEERKKYLEKEFQELIVNYSSTIKRLDNSFHN